MKTIATVLSLIAITSAMAQVYTFKDSNDVCGTYKRFRVDSAGNLSKCSVTLHSDGSFNSLSTGEFSDILIQSDQLSYDENEVFGTWMIDNKILFLCADTSLINGCNHAKHPHPCYHRISCNPLDSFQTLLIHGNWKTLFLLTKNKNRLIFSDASIYHEGGKLMASTLIEWKHTTQFHITSEQLIKWKSVEDTVLKVFTENLEYPKISIEAGISAPIIVSFTVEKNGAIENIKLEELDAYQAYAEPFYKSIRKALQIISNQNIVLGLASTPAKPERYYLPIWFTLNMEKTSWYLKEGWIIFDREQWELKKHFVEEEKRVAPGPPSKPKIVNILPVVKEIPKHE